jgi:acetyltransferase
MVGRVQAALPGARIDGFTVQAMVRKPKAQELIVGASEDQIFGPTVLFGQGGVAVEVLRDRVMALPPLNSVLARDMIARTRVSKLLAGYRDRPPADVAAVSRVLVAVSDLITDFAEIAELDINPLLADDAGVLALDARIVVRRVVDRSPDRLAIKPYPRELQHELALSDGKKVDVRAIRPQDAVRLVELGRLTKPEHLRLRFHGAMKAISNQIAARLSQIDYDREMAFVAFDTDQAILGVTRLVFDPNFDAAEFAIIVRSDHHGLGLGRQLLKDLLNYAGQRGATRVWGDVLGENTNMLDMAKALGASCTLLPSSGGVVRAEFRV